MENEIAQPEAILTKTQPDKLRLPYACALLRAARFACKLHARYPHSVILVLIFVSGNNSPLEQYDPSQCLVLARVENSDVWM